MINSKTPKVTVFIPVYNRQKYVGDAIESILAQTFSDFEILLVDDGSTDHSVDLIRSYTDPRIRLACNEDNLGIPKTRNKGVELARGQYMAMLDSDDRAYPHRLEKQIAFLDSHPDYAQVGSWCRMMDAQGHPLKRIKRQPIFPDDIHAQFLFRCAMSNRSIMARTAILKEYGYRNDYPRCQDYELHVRLAKHYKLGNLPECLVYGRIHPQQITGQTTDLGDTKKQEIISGQLKELGVPFSPNDLAPHLTLSRMQKLGFIPDADYLEWAGEWLLRLQQANKHTHCFSEPAFSHALSEKWFQACWTARRKIGWAVWKYFFSSSLSKNVISTMSKDILATLQQKIYRQRP
jgi:glycosyltransferase involved in cell wall biosynthesis